jgi:hypothetical protein
MRAVTACFLVVVLAACGGDDGDERDSWTDAGLEEAGAVAERMNDAGVACEQYTEYPFDLIAESNSELPLPAAMAECTTDGSENLEIATYNDPDAKDDYISAKQELLCRRAEEEGIQFPGFPYVDGGEWTIQPDEPATADSIADALSVDSEFAGCGDE